MSLKKDLQGILEGEVARMRAAPSLTPEDLERIPGLIRAAVMLQDLKDTEHADDRTAADLEALTHRG